MKKYLVEFIGTFILVFTIGCAVASGSPLAALAIGSALMVMVYAGGHISGANYNPAVSLSLVMRGKLSKADFIPYIVAQIAGGLTGAILSHFVTGNNAAVVHAPGANISMMSALLAEIIGTFALCYVVLNTAVAKANSGNSFYGLAIGFTVFLMAVGLGGISGGAFNPAVGIGRNIADAIVGDGHTIVNIWLYIVGPLAGGVLASIVYNIVNPE